MSIETITHDIIQRGSEWVIRQLFVVFSITLVPSQNFSVPSKGARTRALHMLFKWALFRYNKK